MFLARCETAAVTPLMKMKDFNRNDMANNRPVSSQQAVSKIVQRLFLPRIAAGSEQLSRFH
jgi:hypothetical protein